MTELMSDADLRETLKAILAFERELSIVEAQLATLPPDKFAEYQREVLDVSAALLMACEEFGSTSLF